MSTVLSSEEIRERTKKIWRDAVIGVLIAVVIFICKWGFERTSLGQQFNLASYNFLQQKLMSSHQEGDIPVVVDISDLEVATINVDGETYRATPRDKLLSLIEAITEQDPAAVGVDIDFSPNDQGYLTPGDPQFFQSCLDISKKTGVPIFLGIRRSEIYPPEQWLGAEDYKELAASIFIPNDNRKMLRWLKPTKNSKPVPTMGSVLANSLQYSETHLPESLRWAIDQESERELGHGYSVNEFLVDYSPLETIENTRLRTIEPAGIKAQSHLLKNRAVIIGDGTVGRATDSFIVPARQQAVPGVYLHACAAYTLSRSPLYELTNKGRLAVDIILSLLVLAAITGIRLHYRKIPKDVNTPWLQGFFTFLVVGVAIVIGVIFVSITHVLWDDFIFVLAGLLLHPRVEQWIGRGWDFIKSDIIPIFTRRMFRKS